MLLKPAPNQLVVPQNFVYWYQFGENAPEALKF